MLKGGTNIISSTNFRNNIKNYLEEIDPEQGPVFLTVNGEGTHVIMHVDTYDELMRHKERESKSLMNPERALIEGSEVPFQPEIYVALEYSYRAEWGTLTEEQLMAIRKSLVAEKGHGRHEKDCFQAKVRAYNALVSPKKQLEYEGE